MEIDVASAPQEIQRTDHKLTGLWRAASFCRVTAAALAVFCVENVGIAIGHFDTAAVVVLRTHDQRRKNILCSRSTKGNIGDATDKHLGARW